MFPRWLDELIGTLEANPEIGLAGSKLIYPDGRLQEAGGIVWRDGTAWNYGRLDDARKPEFCYLRDVDYCSGASIALSRKLWDQLGGFDDYYEFAYCEDSDLAFRVRQAGFRTVMQPLSMLVHFEGISSGTDITQGVKSYQIENSKRFLARWKNILAKHRENGESPQLEKERTLTKRALLIDHITPEPDKDAGSVTALATMRALQEVGYKVSFIPATNYAFVGDDSRRLQRMGVEAIYGPYYTNIEQYLHEAGSEIDVVFIFRVGQAEDCLDDIRNLCPQAKVIFHTIDLHFLRELREAKLKNSEEKRITAEETRKREIGLMASVHLPIVHSEYEQQSLREIAPSLSTYVFPLILDVIGRKNEFENRKDILFLGGYRHQPNVDAVLYFVREIWQYIHKARPDMRFLIIGSRPPEELLKLDGKDNIKVVGYVKDLEEYFEYARLSIAPLRYGAGVKGKIGMSLCYGVPCICTSIAAEGMGMVDGRDIIIADEEIEFANAVLTMFENKKLWYELSDNGMEFINNNYSFQRAVERVIEILELVNAPKDSIKQRAGNKLYDTKNYPNRQAGSTCISITTLSTE